MSRGDKCVWGRGAKKHVEEGGMGAERVLLSGAMMERG